jgi:hypothetical protein
MFGYTCIMLMMHLRSWSSHQQHSPYQMLLVTLKSVSATSTLTSIEQQASNIAAEQQQLWHLHDAINHRTTQLPAAAASHLVQTFFLHGLCSLHRLKLVSHWCDSLAW